MSTSVQCFLAGTLRFGSRRAPRTSRHHVVPFVKGGVPPPTPNRAPPGMRSVAVVDLAVERADLPVALAGSRLDDLELRVERERHARVLERDVAIRLRVVDLRDHDVDPCGGEGGVALTLVQAALGGPIGVGRDRVVLVESAEDENRVVRKRNRGRIPAGVLLVGRLRRLRALLIALVAVRVVLSVGVRGKQLLAERIAIPVRARARLAARDPGLGLRVEDVDLVQAVVALHVVAAEDVDAAVGKRDPSVAVRVVEHPLRVAVLGERRAVQREVRFVEKRRVELARVLERVGVVDVEQQLPLHRAVRHDARRDALGQSLPQQVAAVSEPLEGVVRLAVLAEAEERIEPVEDVPERGVELKSRRDERSEIDRHVGQRGVGHVVGRVLRESAVEEDLRVL